MTLCFYSAHRVLDPASVLLFKVNILLLLERKKKKRIRGTAFPVVTMVT